MSAEHPLPTNIIRSDGRKRPGVTSAVSATATSLRLISCIREGTPYSGPRIVSQSIWSILEIAAIGSCAVIDRAYNVDCATVGAVYDRPICSFETETSLERPLTAKMLRHGNKAANARARRGHHWHRCIRAPRLRAGTGALSGFGRARQCACVTHHDRSGDAASGHCQTDSG